MLKFLRDILRRQPPPAAPPLTPAVVDHLAAARAELVKAQERLRQEAQMPPRTSGVNGHVHPFSAHGPMYRGDHYHVCIEPTCWSYLACDKPQAQCTVGPWTCPCCEHVHLSRWMDAEEQRQRQGGGNA